MTKTVKQFSRYECATYKHAHTHKQPSLAHKSHFTIVHVVLAVVFAVLAHHFARNHRVSI